MESIDTNILARWLFGDVPGQQKLAEELLAQDGEFRVSNLAVMELVHLMEKSYGYSRSLVAGNINALINHDKIDMNRNLFLWVLELYMTQASQSFVDCCLLVQAELSHALPLWTFDQKLASQSLGKARLLV